MSAADCCYNKKLLLVVDTSENSRRAVTYVSQMLEGLHGLYIIFLHIINPPEDDYFSCQREKEQWVRQYRLKTESLFVEYQKILVRNGFDPNALVLKITPLYGSSVAECILEEQRRMGCSTIVVGRKSISRSEAFLFGSVSSKIVSHARNCAVWVVE